MTEDELITTLYENAKAGYLSSLPKVSVEMEHMKIL